MNIQIKKANFFQRSIQWLAAKPLASRILAVILPPLDRMFIKHNINITSLLSGLPVIMLITVGRKSKQSRVTPLVAVPVDDKLILIASNFGNKHHPGWYFNVLSKQQVEVLLPDKTSKKYFARIVQEDARPEYWEAALKLYPGFHAYSKRAAPRSIPIILLEK